MKTLSALLSQAEASVSKAVSFLEQDAETAVTDLKNELSLVYNKATTALNEGGLKEDEAYLIGYFQSFIKAIKNKFEGASGPSDLTEKTSVQPETSTTPPVDLYGEKQEPIIVNTAKPFTPEHEANEATIAAMTSTPEPEIEEEKTDPASDTTEEEPTEENTAPTTPTAGTTPAAGTVEGQPDSTIYPPRNMGNEA